MCIPLCRAHRLADTGDGGRGRAVQGRAAAGVLGCTIRLLIKSLSCTLPQDNTLRRVFILPSWIMADLGAQEL